MSQTIEEALEAELNTIDSTISSFPTPPDALYHLVNWHVATAVDPAVNGGYVLVHTSTLQNLQALNTLLEKHQIPVLPVVTAPERDRTPRAFNLRDYTPGPLSAVEVLGE